MMSEDNVAYVLDTSAWLALIEDEEGADRVQDILESTGSASVQVFVSFMSFMEVFYITLQERDLEEAENRVRLMESLPIIRVESTVPLGLTAGKMKARYPISVADAWIAALAKDKDAVLIHKDPEYDQIDDELQAIRLPYKGGT